MNTNRVITWGIFAVFVALIVWGMIAASKKASKGDLSTILTVSATSTDWIIGNASSTVTVVEYSDFQCPACARYFPVVEKLIKENGDKFKFIYRHFPLTQHPNAIPAALASEAAGNQGKFWEMYEMLFKTHDEWENSTDAKNVFAGYAASLGLDMTKYNADVDLKDTQDKIDADKNGGVETGIDATPTFYVNDKKIETPQTYVEFKKIIDEANQPKTQP